MTPEKTDDQTSKNDAANTAPATSSPGVGPTYDRELVYAEDDKPWREKYHGLKGRIQQVESDYQKKLEETQSSLGQLKATLGEKDSKIEQLTGKLTNAGEQLGQLKALQDKVPELEQQARQAAKLRAVLEYPELVNRQVTDMIETEDGKEHEIVTNPILDLVESTNLEGDELRVHLKRLNEIVKAGEPVPEQEKDTTLTDGAVPAPDDQVEETPEYWEQKAREEHTLSISEPNKADEHMDKMLEYSQKAKEARAKLQS